MGYPRHRSLATRPELAGSIAERSWDVADAPGSELVLSVVIPARNEAASLPQLVHEITRAFLTLCEPPQTSGQRGAKGFEIIIVDDGSTDKTPRVLVDLTAVYPHLRYLRLTTSAGQSAALVAGFRATRGDWIATLDADLQNDPGDLVTLWAALPGHDVALGWRVKREDSWTRRAISRWANRVRNMVLGQSIRDSGCSVRIFPRAVALRLPLFKGAHRFLGPLFLSAGCRIIEVPVNHRPRPHGRSHYNLWNRSLGVVFDLFGVAWLMRRPMRYEVVENPGRWYRRKPQVDSWAGDSSTGITIGEISAC
jgi:glycosyltransferase involved in cell wall biosynthesis